jgi:16S rRNA pseudouridine516 synthase
MRLDRFVSHSAGLSRAQVKKLLHAGCIAVDATAVRDPALSVTGLNTVTLEDQVLEWPRQHYVMLHKPAGYVCSSADPGHPVVASLIARPWAGTLHAAGRLDVDTTGLVLLTSDGSWSHALTSPRRACFKTYLVGTRHPLANDLAARFAEGIMLNGETRPTLPARMAIVDSHTARVSIQEGRYHQVKRMFAACGNRVESLHREAIGTILLDPALQSGQWRELSAAEVGMIADV